MTFWKICTRETMGSTILTTIVCVQTFFSRQMLNPKLPFVPGMDICGVVEDIAEGSEEFKVSERCWKLRIDASVAVGIFATVTAFLLVAPSYLRRLSGVLFAQPTF